MDALSLLKKDHANVKTLFKEIEGLGDRAHTARKNLFQKIDEELALHAEIEEKVFYPAFKQRAKDSEERDEVLEAYEEHALVKALLAELENMEPKDESYKPKLNVLMELVKHHVKEEEGTLFPMARELFGPDELKELGDELQRAKENSGAPVRV